MRLKQSMGRRASLIAIGAALSLVAACGTEDDATDDEQGAADPDTIVLGLVPSDNVDKLVEDAKVLGGLIEEELGMPLETFVSDDYAGLRTAMDTGQAHVGMFGPVGLVQAVDQAGAQAVLQSIRFGATTYHTQWFTNQPDKYCVDEPVTVEYEVTDDNDKVLSTHQMSYCNGTDQAEMGPTGEVALEKIEPDTAISFVDELSASGYFYPATQLKEAGVDDYDPQFAGDHDNSVINVYNGDFEVGVSFDDAREGVVADNKDMADLGETVTVFAYSTEIPNDGVAVSGELSEELQTKITDAMLAVAETKQGQRALFDTYEVDGLVPADLDALDAARQVALNFESAE